MGSARYIATASSPDLTSGGEGRLPYYLEYVGRQGADCVKGLGAELAYEVSNAGENIGQKIDDLGEHITILSNRCLLAL